ncbi:MAG: FAD-dependent oxidoreductase, partial [Pseudonocardiales bacterium]|nr:FAD-dependent oxidoreductase [Pseudonocardiales bacterium]
FRGDTIHPSTQELIYQLGWIDELHQIPHSRTRHITVAIGRKKFTLADFGKLKVHCPYLTIMPQWDFLNFLTSKAQTFSSFRLMQSTAMIELIIEGGRVVGVRAKAPDGLLKIYADLVVAADGRHSTCRAQAGLQTIAGNTPNFDVLWFRVSRKATDEIEFFSRGRGALGAYNRDSYWQLAYMIPSHAYTEIRQAGLGELHNRIGSLAPVLRDRLHEIDTWDKVHCLTVRVDRLKKWYRPGLLCIGDAAHAMSPTGGVGINLAIQDAVATANILGPKLRQGTLQDSDLPLIQNRRELPTKIVQKFQSRALHDLYPTHQDKDISDHAPPIIKALQVLPSLRHAMGRFIGLGIRREHINN